MSAPLIERLQVVLERTWGIRPGLVDAGKFVIGDDGLQRLYATSRSPIARVDAGVGQGARTLVRETPDGLRASMYLPDVLVRTLERRPPHLGIGDANVDGFATLVEELDHLLCIADRAYERRTVSLFELELHANVSKYLVLARFLAGRRQRLDARRRTWLRWHLFLKHRFTDPDAGVRARYRDAARHAMRFLDGLGRRAAVERIPLLRRFHRRAAGGKLELIRDLA